MIETNSYTTLLKKQIKDQFGSSENVPANLKPFIDSINEAYSKYDVGSNPSEMSFGATIKELQLENEKLRACNESLDDFNHSVSHDLKTHAINTVSLVKMLIKYLDKKDFKKIDKIVGRLTSTADQFEKVINDFLRISKFEKKLGVQVDNIKMIDFVEELKYEFAPTLESNTKVNLQFYTGDVEEIRFPKEQLNSILRNFITNAIKYGKLNSDVNIHVKFERKQPDVFILSVEDNGIGIDLVKNKNKMFKMFSRLDKHENVEGTGVGLFLSKKLVEKNAGKVYVESEVGVGTKFFAEFSDIIVK